MTRGHSKIAVPVGLAVGGALIAVLVAEFHFHDTATPGVIAITLQLDQA
jgi:hypothetical protein